MKVCVMGMPFVPCRIGQVLGIFPVTAFCFCFGFVKNGGQFIGKAGKIEAVKKGKSKQGDKKSGSGPEACKFYTSVAAKKFWPFSSAGRR